MKQGTLLNSDDVKTNKNSPVECLGQIFENDDARKKHFTELLREKLNDPEFRKIDGFPLGNEDAILELSDPPYYTACPNPWFQDFIKLWEEKKGDSDEVYHREPFAADVQEGKNDPIYNAHSYHTKVPHKAIMRYILHYTNPGDIVFDGVCGTGMTGVAAQMCGDESVVVSLGYQVTENGIINKKEEQIDGAVKWVPFSKIGARRAVLNDLSPVASFISYHYNSRIDERAFSLEAARILSEVEKECEWMYETIHSDGETRGIINCVIWSDVFVCSHCGEELVFWNASIDFDKGKVKENFPCPHCNVELTKKTLQTVWQATYDHALGKLIKQAKQEAVLIVYTLKGEKERYRKVPDIFDQELINKINDLVITDDYPSDKLPEGSNTAQPANSHGATHIHHFYTKRNLYALASFRKYIKQSYLSNELQYQFDSLIIRQSKRTRLLVSYFFHGGGGWVGTPLSGTLYIPSYSVEVQPFETWKNREKKTLARVTFTGEKVCSTSSMGETNLPSNSLDYLFIDPPFGANLNYSELNSLWEAWLGVWTNNKHEAIENKTQGKGSDEYRALMTDCFKEAYRILKPGRWMTVEFSNTKSAIWNSLQTALSEAGFIVGNVSALDKKQGSFKAVTTTTAVKQDLVISAYKPDGSFDKRFESEAETEEGVWDFIQTHLQYLPVAKKNRGDLLFVPERDPRILFDQVVSFFIRRGFPIPLSSQEFQKGLAQRFSMRDGMYFLSEQVAEYDRNRATSMAIKQLSIFVDDEASAIEWLRQELKIKPKTYSEIHPLFLNELSGWKKNELQLELAILLEQNFIKYDAEDDVPSQIHTYLSTNFKDLRGLEKDNPSLKNKAKERWYVPDHNKADDLERLRLRSLMREFETYKEEKKKVKQPRAEALRAGFNACWQVQDYQTILDVASKIPSDVLQEDEKLLMFYDNAQTLTSSQDDDWD